MHTGHRQRLKQKAIENGLKGLSTHEVLELLLTYSIPYKDTNALAHILINTYGNLYNVLNANSEDLLQISGVGKETALFLTLLPQFFEIYDSGKTVQKDKLTNVNSCVEFFRKNYTIESFEQSFLVFLDENDNFIKSITLSSGTEFETSISRDVLSRQIAITNSKKIILFHTHPNGKVAPSTDDVASTKQILAMCKLLGVELLDHIIINRCEYFSFRSETILAELKLEINKKYNSFVKQDKDK